MRKRLSIILLILAVVLVSCATTSYFIGTLGGIYYSTDDYSDENATTSVNNSFSELKGALWMINNRKGSAPATTGQKILFYCNLEDDGFYNEYVPDKYRATSLKDAGFLIVAQDADPVYYSTFTYTGGTKQVKVNYGTGKLVLYSIKTGEKLYTGSTVKGETPPKEFSVYAGTTEVSWDDPEPKAFKSGISSLCSKIASGSISACQVDEEAMAAAGVEVESKSTNQETLNITGVWKATDGSCSYTYTFTSDGLLVREEYYDGVLGYCDVEPYVVEEDKIIVDGYETIGFTYSNKKLSLDGFSDECTFKQTSKSAVNKASQSKLYGVWESESSDGYFKLGLANTGFMIFQGTDSNIGDFSANEEKIYFNDGYESNYWIINDVLYFEDDGLFDHCYSTLRFKRVSSGGKDSTSRTVLTSAEYWDYSTETGENVNRFYFSSNGNFKDEYYYEDEKQSTKNGTFTFVDHIVQLSDGRALTFAYIDSTALGYTL